MQQRAKLFANGCGQAVRLPAAFRFEDDEVFIRRDPTNGDVILSRKPASWDDFLSEIAKSPAPPDFLDAGDRDQGVEDRDPFDARAE